MTVTHSTKKPSKPYSEFPLFAHNNGQWCRKIRGKLYSFGKWSDPTGSLKRHNYEYPFWKEGITPPEKFDGWRVGEVVNEYLTIQDQRQQNGEIVYRSFESDEHAAKQLVKFIAKSRAIESLTPADFRKLRDGILKRFSPAAARVVMCRIRSIFKFAYDEQLIGKPVFYGRGFAAPTKAVIRKHRNSQPKKLFSPDQIQRLLATASPCLKAMVLLSINTGMNNADLGNIKWPNIDLKSGWLDYPRHKTGIQRRAKLWPETAKAIKDYRVTRRLPMAGFKDYIFLTNTGQSWRYSSLPGEFTKLLEAVNKANREAILEAAKRKRRKPPQEIPDVFPHGSFGYFRHTFETVAGGTRDQVAVNAIMGHVDASMAAEYRESIEDERLEAVADHVRNWLFGSAVAK